MDLLEWMVSGRQNGFGFSEYLDVRIADLQLPGCRWCLSCHDRCSQCHDGRLCFHPRYWPERCPGGYFDFQHPAEECACDGGGSSDLPAHYQRQDLCGGEWTCGHRGRDCESW